MQCKFCSNIFGDVKILRQHQTRAQYCLKIQAVIIAKEKVEAIEQAKLEAEAVEKAKELSCQYCGKNFKTKCLLS